MPTCRKCGAVEQEIEIMESEYRWRNEGPPPPNEGWIGPLYPGAKLQIFERPVRKRYYDCKFICPNKGVAEVEAN